MLLLRYVKPGRAVSQILECRRCVPPLPCWSPDPLKIELRKPSQTRATGT